MAMSKQTRSLVSTLVVAAAGALIVWAGYFATKASNDEQATQTEAKSKAFEFEKDQVKKLALTAKGETVTAEKVDGQWRLTSPVQTKADASALDAIVSKLHTLKARDLNANAEPKKAPEFALAPAAQAADFGLDTPSFAVKLTLEDAKELTLEVGEENPYDKSWPFLASGDDSVRLADSGLKTPLDKSLFDLRDKSLVTYENSEVFSVEVTGPKGTWAAERAGDGWQLTKPLTDKADDGSITAVLSRLRNAKAKAFAEESAPADLAKYGFDEPAGEVVFVTGADKARHTLQFGEVEEAGTKKAYARLVEGGPVVEVETALLSDLSKNVDDLRDRTVAAFDREAVTKLEILAGEESFAFTRTKESKGDAGFGQEKFALVGGEGEKLKTWKLSSALYTLSTLKGQAIATDELEDPAAFGFDAPTATYIVSGEGGAELARVLIGKETGGTRYYVMKAGTTRVYEVEKTTVDGLPKTKAEVLDTPTETAAADEAPAAE